MIGQGGNGNVTDGIDLFQKRPVDPEHSPSVSQQKHFPFRRFRVVRPFHRRHGGHAPGTVLLVNLPGARFPHEDGSLADVQKMRDIGGTDDVPPFEGGTLEAILHFRDVVTKLHAHGILHIYFFQN